MIHTRKWSIAAIIFSFILIVIFSYFQLRAPDQKLDFIQVKKGDIKQTVMVTGLIIPSSTSQIKSPISGQVSKLLTQEGMQVKKSQPLIILKPQLLPEELAKQLDTLNQAKATLINAKAHYNRSARLLEKKMIAPDNAAQDKKAYLIAQSGYEAAKQQLELLQQGQTTIAGKLIDNRISSPINGTILKRNVGVGDSIVPVTQSQTGTVLFQIANLNKMIFKGMVSQIDIGKLAKNMPATLEVTALPKLRLKGKVSNIAVQISSPAAQDQSSNSSNDIFSNSQTSVQNGFEIIIDHFHLPQNILLRSGYQATATIYTKERQNVLTIPLKVLHYDKDKTYVLVEQAQSKEPKKVFVKIGATDLQNAELIRGLNLKDKILSP